MPRRVYIPDQVQKVQALYGDLIYDHQRTLRDRLHTMADLLWKAFQDGKQAAAAVIRNYHPDHLGDAPEAIFDKQLDRQDMQFTVAKEHGFSDWSQVETDGDNALDTNFERAVDDLIQGDFPSLQNRIKTHPKLIKQTSQYGHDATLLHYVASNGVEFYRQQVPYNLLEITRFLIEQGADPNAKMKVYGGEHDVLSLLLTSAHPIAAGIMEEMLAVIRER